MVEDKIRYGRGYWYGSFFYDTGFNILVRILVDVGSLEKVMVYIKGSRC